MFEILIGGAIGAIYGLCLDYNLKYSQRKQKKKEEKMNLGNRVSPEESLLMFFKMIHEEDERKRQQQRPVIIIKDCKFYLVKGGSDEWK